MANVLTDEEQALYERMRKDGDIWPCMVGMYSPISQEQSTYKDNRKDLLFVNKVLDNRVKV